MSGIYIHIPFCKQACHYCDFHFSTSLKSKDKLILALIKEIELRKNEFPTDINSLYIGGGTPSLLNEDEIGSMFTVLKKIIKLHFLKEITIELNPEDLNIKKLNFLKKIGVNRLSIGVQSMDDKVLKWMNRIHNKEQVINGLSIAKEIGFEDISLDFIYGTPKFLNRDYDKELSEIIALSPSHLSCYHLTIENGTYFGHLEKIKKLKTIDDEISEKEFLWLSNKLQSHGYEHYEISNFALKGRRSFHNSNYWKQLPYIGIGPGAHSFLKKRRRWNISNNNQYIKAIKNLKSYFEEEELTKNDLKNEQIMLGLRTKNGFNLESCTIDFNDHQKKVFLNKIDKLLKENLIFKKNNDIFMNPEKWLLSELASRELFTLGK
tara:strand:- start:94 stop:1224 length:1131 start_codon:yes stop_codon:yes gene_type:complete